VKQRYQITIPVALREALGIEEGDYVGAALKDGGIFLKPKALQEENEREKPQAGSEAPIRLTDNHTGLPLQQPHGVAPALRAVSGEIHPQKHCKHLTEAEFLAISNRINESLSTVEEAFDKLIKDGWLTCERDEEKHGFPLTVYFYLAALQRAHKLKEAEKKLLYYLTGFEWEGGFLDIVRRKEVRGGEPIIPGTRIAVSDIAISYQEDRSDEELIDKVHQRISKLSSRQILVAKEYYLAHKQEINEYIRENEKDFEPPY